MVSSTAMVGLTLIMSVIYKCISDSAYRRFKKDGIKVTSIREPLLAKGKGKGTYQLSKQEKKMLHV